MARKSEERKESERQAKIPPRKKGDQPPPKVGKTESAEKPRTRNIVPKPSESNPEHAEKQIAKDVGKKVLDPDVRTFEHATLAWAQVEQEKAMAKYMTPDSGTKPKIEAVDGFIKVTGGRNLTLAEFDDLANDIDGVRQLAASQLGQIREQTDPRRVAHQHQSEAERRANLQTMKQLEEEQAQTLADAQNEDEEARAVAFATQWDDTEEATKREKRIRAMAAKIRKDAKDEEPEETTPEVDQQGEGGTIPDASEVKAAKA